MHHTRSSRSQSEVIQMPDKPWQNRSAVHIIQQSLNGLLDSLAAVVEGGTKYGSFPQDITNGMLSAMEEKLALATSYLRTIQNSRSPICTLPPEILNEIFKFTQTPLAYFMPTSPWINFDRSNGENDTWHPSLLAGVCRYWRAVTLTFPSIWTTVAIGDISRAPNANIDLAMLCLRRSYASTVDLHIWDGLSSAAMPWFAETLASQSIRFRGFHIYSFNSGTKLLDIFAECPAPELENLTVQTSPRDGPTGDQRSSQLPVVFAGITPRLRRLTLRHYSSWPGNNFSSLTHLCLEHQATEQSSLRRTSHFLQLLASCPHLEELIVNKAGPNDSGMLDIRTSEPRIGLHNLRKIVFKSCPVPCVARILCHIQISQCAIVQLLRCHKGSASTLLSALAGCANLSNVTRLKLECLVPSWGLHEVTEFSEIPRCIRLTGSGPSAIDIFPGAALHEVASNQYMAALVGVLAASRTEEFWLDADEVVMREALWQRIFFAMPMLKRLYIGPYLAGMTDDYPSVTALHSPDETLGLALPCPNLTEIVFLGTTIDGERLGQPPIRRLLQERKQRGFPLSSVKIIATPEESSSNFARKCLQEDVNIFRRLVDTIEVIKAPHFPVMEDLRSIREFGDKLY